MFRPNAWISRPRAAMPAETAAQLPQGPEWLYELSWAGERVFAAKQDGNARITSAMRGRDLTNRFPVIAAAVAKLALGLVVLEGMVCRVEAWQCGGFVEWAPSTGRTMAGTLRLIATDVLWIDDEDLRSQPLSERKRRLNSVCKGSALLTAAPLDCAETDCLALARQLGADGVIAKRADSGYRPFGRAGDWVRVPADAAAAVR